MSKDYEFFEKEIVSYKRFDCKWFGKNKEEPCWGKVIEDKYYPSGFINGREVTYYTCEGHYDCIEGGKYEPFRLL